MSGDDVVPDREQLRITAARRQERGWWLVAAVAAALLFGTPLAALLISGDPLSGEIVAIADSRLLGDRPRLVDRRARPQPPIPGQRRLGQGLAGVQHRDRHR
jgi:hypothetical protein